MEHQLFTRFDGKQLRLAAVLFAILAGLLALGYFMFLRTTYVVLYNDLRPADASAIVAELDANGVDYRLRQGGTTILVAEGDADAVRLSIAGSEVTAKGTSGFELFNKSDMGLTDFAQKINYQRALQGELARTIMMMDGISDARVHLALPERSLFRSNRSEPKAAVTVTMRRGIVPDETRVAGIQRLVAAAVPDLALHHVVILDDLGRIISPNQSEQAISSETEEQSAIQQYYRARARAAIENTMAGLDFDVKVLVLPKTQESSFGWQDPAGVTSNPASEQAEKRTGQQARQFRLRISIVTASALNPEDQDLIAKAVASATNLDLAAGDSLAFAVGPTAVPPSASPVTGPAASRPVRPLPSERPAEPFWTKGWISMLAILGLIGLLVFIVRNREGSLPAEERQALILRIRQQLRLAREDGDVAGR